jgi:hypothetical protein
MCVAYLDKKRAFICDAICISSVEKKTNIVALIGYLSMQVSG